MKNRVLLVLLSILFLAYQSASEACTLWAAAGSAVENGGTLIVKNRDWSPTQVQSLKFVRSEKGYSYFGINAEGKEGGLRAGINEKGLVVVSATADSIPKNERQSMPQAKGSLVKILKECASVEEAVQRADLFIGPKMLMLADREKIATVEIGPQGVFTVDMRDNGLLYHTNHYVLPGMEGYNKRLNVSSTTRYARIGDLLEGGHAYNFEELLSFSADVHDGPDNSIFRTGSKPGKVRTMAVWAVRIPLVGSPEVYAKLLNAGEEEKVYNFPAADFFAATALNKKS